MPPWPAWVLLGPTGSGKSPLGDRIEAQGIEDRSFAHFDFGRHLRRVAEDETGSCAWGLTKEERCTIQNVLASGSLLENETFGIARKILDGYAGWLRDNPVLVMNGLPRHAGQALRLSDRLRVDCVLMLECPPEGVWERIRGNPGGDRTGRRDDTLPAVQRRLALYRERTEPLAGYYQGEGARVVRIPVDACTTADELFERCCDRLGRRSRIDAARGGP